MNKKRRVQRGEIYEGEIYRGGRRDGQELAKKKKWEEFMD